MKKILKMFVFSGFMAVAGMSVAQAANDYKGVCGLIEQLSGLFAVLKILAFAGAAFVLAAWAWGWITGGDKGAGAVSLEDAKKKGVSLIVGFALLMLVGLIIQFLPGFANCDKAFTNFGQQNVADITTTGTGTK